MRVFELHPSRWAATVILAASTLATVALAMAAMPWPLQVAGLLAIFAVAQRAVQPRGHGITTLSVRKDGRWTVHYADGRRLTGLLQGDSFVHPWLCVVNIRDGWRRASVTVPADALTPDTHRRLRTLLRWLPRPCARPEASWSRQSPWPG